MTTVQSFSLTHEERRELEQVLRQRKADGLIVRRANALLLLDDGIGAIEVARVLYLDAETVLDWRRHVITHPQHLGISRLDFMILWSKGSGTGIFRRACRCRPRF